MTEPKKYPVPPRFGPVGLLGLALFAVTVVAWGLSAIDAAAPAFLWIAVLAYPAGVLLETIELNRLKDQPNFTVGALLAGLGAMLVAAFFWVPALRALIDSSGA